MERSMKNVVEQWEKFENAALTMINALPFKDDKCKTCGDAMRDKLRPDITLHRPETEFLHRLGIAMFVWEQERPMECYDCQEEENGQQAMAEAEFKW